MARSTISGNPPAVLLGTVIAKQLAKLGLRAALPIAATLYLIGLGGDSYYGAACVIAPLNAFYKAFFEIFSYTRNGLFFAPLFLLLGAAGLQWKPAISAAGTLVSLLAMSFEAVWLHHAGLPRHDSMYLLLPICSVFLFSWLLQKNCGQNKSVRSIAALIYLLHPWCIVLVRGGAKLLHLEPLLIENSLIHFLAATVLSLGIGCLAVILRPRRLDPTSRAWKEINLTALQHNAQVLQAQAGDGCALMAVLKADAYGHGAVICARALQRAGIKAFAVACLSEAITLRKAGIRGVILVLGYTPPSQAALLHRWRITQSLVDASYAALLSAQNKRLHVHLALDTGMHRLGIAAEDMQAITAIYQLPNLQVDGIFSHLCVSDSLLRRGRRVHPAPTSQLQWSRAGY